MISDPFLCDSFMPHDFSCANLRAIVLYISHFHLFLSITWASADVYGLLGISVLAKEGLLMVQEGASQMGDDVLVVGRDFVLTRT